MSSFICHVIMGGVLWDGYSHVRQTELTGNGALDAGMLRVFTVGCGLLALLFQLLSMYYSVNNKFKKLRSLELFF